MVDGKDPLPVTRQCALLVRRRCAPTNGRELSQLQVLGAARRRTLVGTSPLRGDFVVPYSRPCRPPRRTELHGSLAGRQRRSMRDDAQLAPDLPRSTFYYAPKPVSDGELALMVLIDRCHLKHPFYGSRRIRDWWADRGHRVNRKKVQRLMRTMDLTAQYPKRNLSLANQAHKIYPYRLRDLVIDRPTQVWATDVTYIPMARGFVYRVAIMDWHSRKVLSWRVSNTLDASFCVEALEAALETYGAPEIFNTDQGSQFTSEDFTGVLKRHGIRISRDGKGRWVDNVFVERWWRSVKYEDVYLKAYDSIAAARASLGRYFAFYNTERRHQSLDRRTPDSVYYETAAKLAA